MADQNPTIWNGEFLQFMPRADAIIARDAGLVQIFEGPLGYDPDFAMKYPSEFPFAVAPPLVASRTKKTKDPAPQSDEV